MNDKDLRNNILYILGILFFSGLIFFLIMQTAKSGFGIFQDVRPDKIYTSTPEFTISKSSKYFATLVTSKGNVKIELFADKAPIAVNNFLFLAKDKYYDGVKVHRIVPNFIIQTGSRLSLDSNPYNDGIGGPGYRFEDETNWDSIGLNSDQKKQLELLGFSNNVDLDSFPLDKYYIAMANAGPNTNGSQFFIVLATKEDPTIAALQGKHTVFAKVVEGFDIIDDIAAVDLLDADSTSPRPAIAIVINSINID